VSVGYPCSPRIGDDAKPFPGVIPTLTARWIDQKIDQKIDEKIVLKCLERDRAARYDSARALADDLGRFLNGEPVVARPVGTWYRLRKRLARQRRLVAAAAFVALGVAIGWAISTRVEAGERERFAQQFTEAVESIESTARYSAMSPLHDIRGDREVIRARMAEIKAEIERGGEVAAGPGHYALGRGYLALDDDARARDELESAWNRGFREPRVAYALAQAIGHLYRRSLAAAALTAGPVSRPLAKQDGAKKPERLSDVEALAAVQRDVEQEMEKLREARQREVDRQYRGAILAYLAASNGAEVRSTEYFAALDAYYEGHFEEALHHLDAIGSGLPCLYEASELRGDTLFARALTFRKQGEKERARNDFEAGRKISCPTLILWAEKSHTHREFDAREAWPHYCADIRRFNVLPCAHYPMEEAPDLLYAELDEFFKT